jgi:hypothetical protein
LSEELLITKYDRWYFELEEELIVFTSNIDDLLKESVNQNVMLEAGASPVLGAAFEQPDTRLSVEAKPFAPSASSSHSHTSALSPPESSHVEHQSPLPDVGAAVCPMPIPQSEGRALQQAISALHLSNAVVDKFDGDPIKYTGFIAGFKSLILPHVYFDSDRLYQ